MTKRILLVSFFLRKARAKFLLSGRDAARKFLAFFRGFAEEDARALLSAYGLYRLEIARLQDDRPDKEKETNVNFGGSGHRNSIDCFPGPIPIGMHPDIFRTKRTNGS